MKNLSFTVRCVSWVSVFGLSLQTMAEAPEKKLATRFEFAPPVKLTAKDGKAIDVTTGHAAPRVYDFDKDGVKDLLVGEFGDGTFTGESTAMKPSRYCNARIRIYLNKGTDAKPVYDDFEYLKAGGKVASVPNA